MFHVLESMYFSPPDRHPPKLIVKHYKSVIVCYNIQNVSTENSWWNNLEAFSNEIHTLLSLFCEISPLSEIKFMGMEIFHEYTTTHEKGKLGPFGET